MSLEKSGTTINRRRRLDRRSSETTIQFPIITTQGVCVRKDRRSVPDRRISKIVVREWEVKNSVFDVLFEGKHKPKQ